MTSASPPPSSPAANPPSTFLFEGTPVPGRPGQSVAAALTEAGIRSWRTTRFNSEPRGVFCGIGVCFDCLVQINGRENQRACLAPATPNARVTCQVFSSRIRDTSSRIPGPVHPDASARAAYADRVRVPMLSRRVKVAVVGAGPAGIAAAVTVAELGLTVALIDNGARLGGQYWRHAPTEPGSHHAEISDDKPFNRWQQRLSAQVRAGTLTHLSSTDVWSSSGGDEPASRFTLRLQPTTSPGASTEPDAAPPLPAVVADSLILCPGGYDRQLPVPGWHRPGVIAAGGAQALLKEHQTVAGQRMIVAGTGPFLLPVATALAAAGADVVEVCEASSPRSWGRYFPAALMTPGKLAEGLGYATALARRRIPYRVRTAVIEIRGNPDVTSVTVARLDRDGRPVAGSERDVDVDAVALGWGFVPSIDLGVTLGAATRLDDDQSLVISVDAHQRSSVPYLYVAGEATGVGGAVKALAEGELAGLSAIESLGRRISGSRRRQLQRTIRRHRRFATAISRSHRIPTEWPEWLTADTVICRCEEVPYSTIQQSQDTLGTTDAKSVKLMTRCGMGWCQGRICGFAYSNLAARSAGRDVSESDLLSIAKRFITVPVTLSLLAESGHHQH